jgi:hypothetical protein
LERNSQDISIRSVGEVQAGTKATVVVVDNTAAPMMEQRDDLAGSFEEAIGLSPCQKASRALCRMRRFLKTSGCRLNCTTKLNWPTNS